MPQPITNTEILDFIDKMKEKSDTMFKATQERYTMNEGFKILMDNAYGSDNWHDVDLRKKEFITDKEITDSYYVVKNPSLIEKVIPDDVELTITGEDNAIEERNIQEGGISQH